MIYLYEVENLITALAKAGIDVHKDDYVIVAGSDAKFDNDLYPIQIVTSYYAPKSVAFIVPRKVAEALDKQHE